MRCMSHDVHIYISIYYRYLRMHPYKVYIDTSLWTDQQPTTCSLSSLPAATKRYLQWDDRLRRLLQQIGVLAGRSNCRLSRSCSWASSTKGSLTSLYRGKICLTDTLSKLVFFFIFLYLNFALCLAACSLPQSSWQKTECHHNPENWSEMKWGGEWLNIVI